MNQRNEMGPPARAGAEHHYLRDGVRETWVYADGHAHIYPVFSLQRYFAVGLQRAARFGHPLLLLLTESVDLDYFAVLRDNARGSPRDNVPPLTVRDLSSLNRSGISIHLTSERQSLAVRQRDNDSPGLYMIAGRQFDSVERLEVQAIGLDPARPASRYRDSTRSAEELLKQTLAAGAAAVLPWGFGKWLGERGREVMRLSVKPEFAEHPLFFLGDIAARCWPWPTPSLFRSKIRVLPGTDVLPLQGAESRLGTYGFRIFGRFDPASPARSLLDLLRRTRTIETIGRRQFPLHAITDQMRYRLRRRRSHRCL